MNEWVKSQTEEFYYLKPSEEDEPNINLSVKHWIYLIQDMYFLHFVFLVKFKFIIELIYKISLQSFGILAFGKQTTYTIFSTYAKRKLENKYG